MIFNVIYKLYEVEKYYVYVNASPYMSAPRYPLSVPGFLSLGTADILGGIILYWGKESYPLHCRILSMHWIATATPSSVVTTKNVSRHCQMFSGVQNSPHVKSTDLCFSDIVDQTTLYDISPALVS